MELRTSTLLEFFDLLVKNVFQLISEQFNLYGRQKNNHNFVIFSEEHKIFSDILILSGKHVLHQQTLCWADEHDIGVKMVKKDIRKPFQSTKTIFALCEQRREDKYY